MQPNFEFIKISDAYKKCSSCDNLSDDGGYKEDLWYCLDCLEDLNE